MQENFLTFHLWKFVNNVNISGLQILKYFDIIMHIDISTCNNIKNVNDLVLMSLVLPINVQQY